MDYDKMMAAHSIEVQEENGKLKSKIRESERENYELKAENKKIKEELNFYYKAAKQFRKDKDVLMKENEELEKGNKELEMKIDTLELCIKNKDELLEEYRKKIDKLRTDNIYEEGLYE